MKSFLLDTITMVNIVGIIVGILLASGGIVALVAENCRIKKQTKCADGSTIALTVVLSLIVAVTSFYWFRPVFLPHPRPLVPLAPVVPLA